MSCHSDMVASRLLIFLPSMCKCKECFKELDYHCYGFCLPPGQAGKQAGASYVCSVHKEGGLVSRTVSLVLS